MTFEEMLAQVKGTVGEVVGKATEGLVKLDALDTKIKEVKESILTEVKQLIPTTQQADIHIVKNEKKELRDKVLFMMGNIRNIGDPAVLAQAKAMGISVGASGGYLLPEEFRSEVLRKAVKTAVIRSNSRVFTGVEDTGSIPRETGTVTLEWGTENTEIAETEPTFGNVSWALNELRAIVPIGNRLLSSSGIDVVSLLTDMFAEQVPKAEDKEFCYGTGSNRPKGLFKDTTGMNVVSGITGSTLIYDDIINIFYKLPVQYRRDACWLMHNTVIQLLANIKDTQKRPIFLRLDELGNGATVPDQAIGTLLGRPVLEQNDIPINLTGTTSLIGFGNLMKAYLIFDKGQMEMATSTDAKFTKNQTIVRVLQYVDAKVGIAEAMAVGTLIK